MDQAPLVQRIISKVLSDHLETWIESFLFDRKTQNVSPGTLKFYQQKLGILVDFCQTRAITQVGQIAPEDLRRLMVALEEAGHNPGGRHAVYRTVRAFLNWYEIEAEPEDWHNPIEKVKAPKVPTEPLEPVSISDIQSLVNACDSTFTGKRDKAILLGLLDTGARAQEFLDIDLEDVNLMTGAILIRSGKGRKPRSVFVGKTAKKAIMQYLRSRSDECSALWVTDEGDRLSYWGLRAIITRRADKAGVAVPGLHDFRRAFAINMLRSGIDLVTLSRLMGHTSLAVLQRYLKQLPDDLAEAHRRASPVDRMDL